MEKYLNELNDAQRLPVECTEGPMMIIAGAGSGKTRVLTYRIAHLINNGIDPFNILALTFTNKAAREMQIRISKIVGQSNAKSIWMGTFHSVFARILRSEAQRIGFPSNFTIYDTEDSMRLITHIIKDMNLDKDIYKSKQVQNRISSLKNNLITVHAYNKMPEYYEADAATMRPRTVEIYSEYVDRCFKAGAMDFDDLLLRTNEVLARFPDALAKYQERFKYILVDEYQDTNHSQYLIVKALADRYQNLCVVGDDSQSIYSFRGANIRNILNFQADYPQAKIFKLEQNYRSTANIVGAAGSVIKNNREQLEKAVWTHNEDGSPIRVVQTATDNEEGFYIAKTIKALKGDFQFANSDFALLYRTNAQSRALEDALRKNAIPYRIWGGLSFYQRKEIKDVLAYFRLAINPKDEEALLRVINYPTRGIGDTTINKLVVTANNYKRSVFEVIKNISKIPNLGLNAGTMRKLDEFATLIESFIAKAQNEDAFAVAEYVLKQSGLLRVLSAATDPEEISRYENVQELVNSIRDFCELQKELVDGDNSLPAYVQDISLATDLDIGDAEGDLDRVALMTIHTAKGLEFPVVFITGMEEELFPSMMSSQSREDLEEERRLFYVALTRAEKHVYLTYALQRYKWGKLTDGEISRFVDEIDDKYVQYVNPRVGRKFTSPVLDASLFGAPDLRTDKPKTGTPPLFAKKETNIRNFKPVNALQKDMNGAQQNLSLVSGDRIEHMHFGKGTIEAVEGAGSDKKATVKFDDGNKRTLLLKFAKLEKLN